jgi:hypothetical protein
MRIHSAEGMLASGTFRTSHFQGALMKALLIVKVSMNTSVIQQLNFDRIWSSML